MASHSSPAATNSSPATPRWKIPSPYPPCIHAANELEPIAISQMEPEIHHRGKRTAVRLLGSPTRMRLETLITTIEDEEGTPSFLQLFHQPRETAVPAEQILRPGDCYLIKEPFFTFSANDAYSTLRVDHPSDILMLPHGHKLLPAKWSNNNAVVRKSSDTRINGNNAADEERWAEAESLQVSLHTLASKEFYTTAARTAETAEELRSAYLNRSWTNLRLGRPATALADAIKSHGEDSSARTEKGLLREASALYALAKYGQCLDTLQILRTAHSGNRAPMQLIDRAHARLQERHSGQYDFLRMYEQAKATPPLIDCATYIGAVEIKDSPEKGRGVFTTRKVLAGELLICEKAFGYACCGNEFPRIKNMTKLESSKKYLRTQIVQKLFHNIEDARSFGDLHHGDYDAVSVCEVDGRPVVDSFLVQKVIDLTGSRAPRTTLSTYRDVILEGKNDLKAHYTCAGVWCLTSHINHCCISNTSRSFIGDMQIVRATRDLEEGSELFACYILPYELGSYEKVQERLRRWDFTCGCALCLDRKVTPKRVLDQRTSLVQSFKKFIGFLGGSTDIPNAQKMLESFEQTYPATAKVPGGVRLEIWLLYVAVGTELLAMDRPSEAIEWTLKGLEALGFVISASPPRRRPKSSKPELLIKQWGMAVPSFASAFLVLQRAYKRIAPRLSLVARDYTVLAYTMVMGEKQTILQSMPDIAVIDPGFSV